MSLLTRAVMARWLARWLLRGGPLAIATKLLAVGALGAWKYRRERKRAEAGRIDADYEVLGPDRIAPIARPGEATEPGPRPTGNGSPEVEQDPTRSE